MATSDQLQPYRSNFLGSESKEIQILLPTFSDKLAGKVFKNSDPSINSYFNDSGQWRNYIHYSVATNADVRQPICVAVNINQDKIKSVPRKRSFSIDPRIPEKYQLNSNYYDDNVWDKGHMAMRSSTAWGDDEAGAKLASDETFYFTNCCLQHFNLNQDEWLDVENYARGETNDKNDKITVFSGPIYGLVFDKRLGVIVKKFVEPKSKGKKRDSAGEEIQPLPTGEDLAEVPSAFFKVISFVDRSDKLKTRCFILRQGASEIKDRKTKKDVGEYEVSLAEVEEKTGLIFSKVLHESNSFVPIPTAKAKYSGVFIASALVNPAGGNSAERMNEWVSIANYSREELDLTGWKLSDTSGKRDALPLSGKLLSGETIRINPLKNEGGQVILHNKGGTLELIDPEQNIIDEESYYPTGTDEVTIFEAPATTY